MKTSVTAWFEKEIDGENYTVMVSATDVNQYECDELEVKFYDDQMRAAFIKFDATLFAEIEEEAHGVLFEKKFYPELQLGEI